MRVNMVQLLITAAIILEACEGYKILVVFPNPSRSHGNLGDGLVRHLLNAGHQVTYVTPFVTDSPPQNLTYVDVSGNSEIWKEASMSIEKLVNKELVLDQHNIFHIMRKISILTFENKNVKNILESPTESFDVAVVEWTFNELYSGFAAVFKCPYIWMYPYEPNFKALSLIDDSTNPAYTANIELNIIPPFTFVERIRNLWFQITFKLQYYFYYDSLEKATYDQLLGSIQMKKYGSVVPYDILRYNASLMLSYSHNSLGEALSIPQNLIPVGGYHVDKEPAPLPVALKKILDNAKEGVIYFSMGSLLKSKEFPKHIFESIMGIFENMKYTILWKFEGDLSRYPSNVHLLKWAPQQSILAHPNCILFISHGGLLSTTEAIHFGVPIIGVPVYYDQFGNVNRAVKRGFAKKVILSDDFAEDLKAAIENILNNVTYASKATELSLIYHDRPISPGASLVHWVEHVVATRGAYHLRSPAFLIPWYQKYYTDLAAVILVTLASVIFGLKPLIVKDMGSRVGLPKKKSV